MTGVETAAESEGSVMSDGVRTGRDGSSVIVWIENGLGIDGKAWSGFTLSLSGEIEAEAFRRAIARALADRIKAVRRQEYERGWKEGRAKRGAKCDYFFSTLFLRPERG